MQLLCERRRLVNLLAVILTVVMTACSAIFSRPESAETCGGAQRASARATLPDTGIGGSQPVLIALSQHDPFLIGEVADLEVAHLWPQSNGPNPEANPRVRLVRDDGRVLLDTVSTRQIPNGSPNPSWIVFRTFSNAELRNAIFDAIRTESITLELWPATGTRPGTVVRPKTQEAFVGPILTCR
jgi:hypothetical protein